jgi:protein O-mannosyl-transferase
VKRVFLIVAIPLAFLLYGIALEAPIQLDDGPVLADAVTPHGGRRVVGITSFWMTHQAFGLMREVLPFKSQFYHRLGNILIHVLAATALFWMVKELSDRTRIAAIAGLLFLVHPVQTQAVTYISQRFESLAALFILISGAAYVRFRKSKGETWLAVSIGSGLLAFLTKETAIVLPVWLVLIELCFFERNLLRSRVLYFVALAAALFAPVWTVLSTSVGNVLTAIPWHLYFASQGPVLAKYLQLCFWPAEQFLYYDFGPVESLTAGVILTWLLVLGVVGTGIYLLRRDRLAAFGIFSFFILMLVTIVLPLPDLIFEHRIYPAFAGVAIAIAALCGKLNPKVVLPIIGVLVVLLGARTILRNSQWNDEISFLELHRAKFPTDPDILARLGSYYYQRGFVKKGLEVTLEAKKYENRLNSYYSQARRVNVAANLVVMYLAIGDQAAAALEARRAVALDPNEPFALRSLAAVQMNEHDYPGAVRTWRKFIAARQTDPEAWTGLKETYRLMGDDRGAKLAEGRLKQLSLERGEQVHPVFTMPEGSKLYVIFGGTMGFLALVFLALRTLWEAFNQQKLGITPLEDRPSS